MKCAIMQPTYLPWSGYFNLIASTDIFIFLDDVQYERRSWQSRNRILNQGKEVTLTVSVRKHARDSIIRDILISEDSDWRERHLATLRHAYSSSPYFLDVYPLLQQEIGNLQNKTLSGLNIALVRKISDALGISRRFILASELGCEGRRSQHLLKICCALGADEYLSAKGSREYIESEGTFSNSNILVSYQSFTPNKYSQSKSDEFITHLSIIDVAMSLGWEAAGDYVWSGYPNKCT